MSPRPTSRSADIQRLRNEGYEVSVIDGHLVVSHVPYVTVDRQIAYGKLISDLTLAGDVTTIPRDHVAYFAGDTPCDSEGRPMEGLINSRGEVQRSANLTAQFMFSHKPQAPAKYEDYFEKMTTYVAILLSQAQAIDPDATAQTYAVTPEDDVDSVFSYIDTASTRAGIAALSVKLELDRVSLVGLGGTGAYVLDLLAKTPIRELHLFDGDRFLQHNAFRAPGAASLADLTPQPFKVDYLTAQYGVMRKGIVAHASHVDANNVQELEGSDFVFLSVDDGPAKKLIIEYLESAGIPFIDVGMGLYESGGKLGGLVRTTLSTNEPASRAAARARISFEESNDIEYTSNIQIADLNALNAALAVIKFKREIGFFHNNDDGLGSIFMIDSNTIVNEDDE